MKLNLLDAQVSKELKNKEEKTSSPARQTTSGEEKRRKMIQEEDIKGTGSKRKLEQSKEEANKKQKTISITLPKILMRAISSQFTFLFPEFKDIFPR